MASSEQSTIADPAPDRPIKTAHERPPIPTARFDWTAVRDGWEPECCRPVGRGDTEAAAIADLLEQEADDAD